MEMDPHVIEDEVKNPEKYEKKGGPKQDREDSSSYLSGHKLRHHMLFVRLNLSIVPLQSAYPGPYWETQQPHYSLQ